MDLNAYKDINKIIYCVVIELDLNKKGVQEGTPFFMNILVVLINFEVAVYSFI